MAETKRDATVTEAGRAAHASKSISLALAAALAASWPATGLSAGGIKLNRLKVEPSLSASVSSTDNLFLSEEDEKSEIITILSPELALYFALTPQNELSLVYHGDFEWYQDYDKYDNDSHTANAAWSLRQPRGSELRLGGGIEDSSIQPRNEERDNRDYLLTTALLESKIRIGSMTGLELGYDFAQRRFDEVEDEQDEFDRHTAGIGITYDRFALTSLAARYSYEFQDNNDPIGPSTDMYTHTVLAGVRRQETARLSGSFMAGYLWTEFDSYDNFSGMAFNADMTYTLTRFSRLVFTLDRRVFHSTVAERDTNIYYDSTRGSVGLALSRWDKIDFNASVSLRNNAYDGYAQEGDKRTDELLGVVVRGRYHVTGWLSLNAEYRYRNNDSNKETFSYEENMGLLGVTFSI